MAPSTASKNEATRGPNQAAEMVSDKGMAVRPLEFGSIADISRRSTGRNSRASRPVANAGDYEVAGNWVTIHPAAAKFPVVMKAKANEVYEFRIEGKNLYFSQRRNARGQETQGAATKLRGEMKGCSPRIGGC